MIIKNRLIWDVFCMAAAGFIWASGYSLYVNFFPLYIKELGGNEYHVSLITSIPLFMGVLGILGGILCDYIDRKKIILFGWAITIPGPLIWFFADNWQWLAVGQVVLSLSFLIGPAVTL